MLKNIKSLYILRKPFNFISDERKLNLIKYNANFQNKFNINLYHFKIYSGRYIIYETKEKGKEYNYKNNLIYEGKFLNGKRHGKGKECNNKGIILFEGEYFKGKRWNGKGYDKINNIKYELKEGKGIALKDDDKRNKIFEGQFINGEKNGICKEYNEKGLILYEGTYLNNKRFNGKGKEYNYDNKLIFEGEYKYGKRWNGDIYYKEAYKLKEGKGFIKEYFVENDSIFEGEYLNGQKNGKGKEYNYENKLIFEGEYKNGKRNGEGKEYYYDIFGRRLRYEGVYMNNFRKKGKEYINGGLEYEGEYLFNKKYNGKGYNKSGKIIYELNNGNGEVKEYNKKGNLLFKGEYLNGKRNGKGKLYFPNSTSHLFFPIPNPHFNLNCFF